MKILDKVCSFERWKPYLALGMLINGLFSFLLQAIVFVVGKKGISIWVSIGLDILGFLVGVLFFLLAFFSYRKQLSEEKSIKEFYMAWWKDIVIFLLCLAGMEYVPASLYAYVGLLSPIIAFGIAIIVIVLFAVLEIRATIGLVVDLQVENEFIEKKELYKKTKKCSRLILFTLGLLLWFTCAEAILDYLFLVLAEKVGHNFNLLLANEFLFAAGSALIIVSYWKYMDSVRSLLYEDGMVVREDVISKRKSLFIYITTAVLGIYACVNVIYQTSGYRALDVEKYISELMDYAEEEAKFYRTAEAIRVYVRVEDYLEALEAFSDDNEEVLAKYVTQNPDDDFYWRLYYSYTEDMGMAKEALLESGVDARLCHDILRYYKEVQNQGEVVLTEEEYELIEECLQIGLSRGEFIDTTLKFHEDSLRNKTINDMKEMYEQRLMYNDIFVVLQDSGMKGYVDSATAKQLIQLANENPDNKAYQLLAVMGASQYEKDKASHYKDVVVCAKRLDELLKQDTKDMSLLVEEKLYLAQMVMNCRDYKAALEILNDVRKYENTDVQDSVLFCYLELKQNEEVISYIEELKEGGADRAVLDYMSALSYLKLKNVDKALENGVLLAQKVALGGEDREKNNTLLYSFAEYLCIRDEYKGYIDYQYRVKSYNNEQLAILNQSELLKNYVDAMNAIYNSKDIEVALKTLDKIEKVEPDLSTTWFLRGTIYFDKGQYDEAIESFQKCISIDENNITATYCLAVLYDIKKDYEASARLCEQILNIMPTVNHEQDWYGITYHTNALNQALQKYLGGTR